MSPKPHAPATRAYASEELARLLDRSVPGGEAPRTTRLSAERTRRALATGPGSDEDPTRIVLSLREPAEMPFDLARRSRARSWLLGCGAVALALAVVLGSVIALDRTSTATTIALHQNGPAVHTPSSSLPAAPAAAAQRASVDAGATTPTADAPVTPAPDPAFAVDALAAGREHEALDAYRALARARPEQPVFAAIAAILARKIAARCHREEGGPCESRAP